MVNINKINWLSTGTAQVGRTQLTNTRNANIKPLQGENTLQNKLEAIDRGDISTLSSFRMSSNKNQENSTSLLERLNAIGTGELSPSYNSNERKLDWKM